MSDAEFRLLLDLWMVSDPWPLGYGHDTLTGLLDREAHIRGYDDHVVAYHKFKP